MQRLDRIGAGTLIARRGWHPGAERLCLQQVCSLVFFVTNKHTLQEHQARLSDQSISKCPKPEQFCFSLQYLIKHPRSSSKHGLLPSVRCHHRADDRQIARGVLCPLERSPRERSGQGTVGTSKLACLMWHPDSIPSGFDFHMTISFRLCFFMDAPA